MKSQHKQFISREQFSVLAGLSDLEIKSKDPYVKAYNQAETKKLIQTTRALSQSEPQSIQITQAPEAWHSENIELRHQTSEPKENVKPFQKQDGMKVLLALMSS